MKFGYNMLLCRPTEEWYQFMRREPEVNLLSIHGISELIFRDSFAGEKGDKDALDALRTERRQKIEELKEKSNYYVMQQLIQVQPPSLCYNGIRPLRLFCLSFSIHHTVLESNI